MRGGAGPKHNPRAASGSSGFFDTYTKDLTADDIHLLFTRDTREAYQFFTHGVDSSALKDLPPHRRALAYLRQVFLAFSMKLSPARRVVYAMSLVFVLIGLLNLFRGFGVHGSIFQRGTWPILFAFFLVNLLVILEVADRLSLKNDLEIAREIQQAMLPDGVYRAPGVETLGLSRPANTVGGDFYDILPLDDGRLVIALGDVAGKGSPAALLMALLLAMLRTLVDEKLETAALVTRLNVQVCRHAPGSRFITLFYAVYQPLTGELTYVSAGHTPPLLIRGDGRCDRLTDGGIALGLFDHSSYTTGRAVIEPDDLLAVYSDGITEAENGRGEPFDEAGLERALGRHARQSLSAVGASVVRAVDDHKGDVRLADDLTILLLRRTAAVPAPASV